MTFISTSRLAKTLASKVGDDWKSDAAELAKEVPTHAIVLTETDKKWANLPVSTLNDLFHHESALKGDTFRTVFSVVKVEGTTAELVKSYNKSTKKTSSAKGVKGGELVW